MLATTLALALVQLQLAPPPPPPAAAPYYVADPSQLRLEYEQGQVLRGSGIGLTALGGIMTIGATLYWAAHIFDDASERNDGAVVGFFLAGGVSLGVGIPLIVSGQKQMNRARRAGLFVGFTPIVAPAPGGAVAGVRLFNF
jgi:hypothetical protein